MTTKQSKTVPVMISLFLKLNIPHILLQLMKVEKWIDDINSVELKF